MESYPVVTTSLTQIIINKINPIDDNAAADHVFRWALNSSECTVISYINAHAFNLCYKNNDFREALLKSDWLLRDGKGIELLFKAANRRPGINMCGTDTIPQLLTLAKGRRIALIGTQDPYLQQAGDFLKRKGYNVVLLAHGFHSIPDYLPLVRQAKPDVIILGMGMPKQEGLSIFLKEQLNSPCVIVNGGAIIDYWGEKVVRAPQWIRQIGAEWLFRLLLEPRRLFKRYVVGNFVFLRRVQSFKRQEAAVYKNV